MDLQTAKNNLITAYTRLHEYSEAIRRERLNGGDLKKIEELITSRRSLAEHCEHVRLYEIFPLVDEECKQYVRELPKQIAQCRNELAGHRERAAAFLTENGSKFVAAILELGGSLVNNGRGLNFPSEHIYLLQLGQRAYVNSEVGKLEHQSNIMEAEKNAGGPQTIAPLRPFPSACARLRKSADLTLKKIYMVR